MSFYRETAIKSVRKPRICAGCRSMIEVGQPALDCAGHNDGDFWACAFHPECRAAEIALNDLKDFRFGDDWFPLEEIENDDWLWLLEDHPAVAARMKITRERYERSTARPHYFTTQETKGHE